MPHFLGVDVGAAASWAKSNWYPSPDTIMPAIVAERNGANLGRVDLNLLVALEALIDEANVTRAGERVHLSQPAMSDALQRLRRLFGDELLVRVGRQYQLTAFGIELREPLHELVQMAGDIIQRREMFDPATDLRTFNVVASEYSIYLLVQPLLRRVARGAPVCAAPTALHSRRARRRRRATSCSVSGRARARVSWACRARCSFTIAGCASCGGVTKKIGDA